MMNECDLVIVEGDSQTTAPKIEVFRSETGSQPLAMADSTIHAVVTDDDPAIERTVAKWSLSDLNSIVSNIELFLELSRA